MQSFDITSRSNERIKRLVRLRDRRHRDREGVFVVEGVRLVERAMAAGIEPIELYSDGSVGSDFAGALMVEPSVLDKASYRSSSQGVIAVLPQLPVGIEDLVPTHPALVLVAQSIEKPGNLGAMLRTAAAVGADGLITIDDTVDPFNPNVVRSSTGALFTVPLAVSGLHQLSSWLAEHSVALIAATPEAPTPMWKIDLTGPSAILVGPEDAGISPSVRELADSTVSIPISGAIDSLNASVSLALLAYEAVRQRSWKVT